MSFLRPLKMVKVGLIGLKDDRETILSVLHDLNVAQVEPISKEALEHLEPEHASDLQRAIGEQLIRFRGLRAALPPTPSGPPRTFRDLDELLATAKSVPIDDEVGALRREEDRLLTDRKARSDEVELLSRHSYYTDRLEYLHGPHIVSFFGEADREEFPEFRAELPKDAHLVVGADGERVRFLVVVPTPSADAVGRAAQQRHITLTVVPRLTGTPAEVLPPLEAERKRIDARLAEIRARLVELSRQSYPTVLTLEEAFAIENRKIEVYTRLGAGRRTFALEGWIPVRERMRLEQAVAEATQGRTHVYDIPTHETPPTLMENPKGVRWYEFFIRFYSLPQADEWDPTWVFAVVFPIFYGFMLGDIGYGVVILGICLWMIAGFPGGQHLPAFLRNFLKRIMSPAGMRSLAYALLPGCAVALASGVLFNEFFGFHLFSVTYLDPITAHGVSTLLLLTGYVGLAMVTFGFFLGALKEYLHHHIRGALGKTGGILFAWGIATVGLALIRGQSLNPAVQPLAGVSWGILAVGAVLMVGGEGIQQGFMGLIEVVSHILSYTRLAGILLASVVLALVANSIGTGLIHNGTVVGLLVGPLLIFMVAAFNVVLGVFEPGIQGARLIFVENFSKYYTGNGRVFRPFGSKRSHTLPLHASAGTGAPPVPAPPSPAPSS